MIIKKKIYHDCLLALALCISITACASWEGGWDVDILDEAPLSDSDYLVINNLGYLAPLLPQGWQYMKSSKDLRLVTPHVVKFYFRNNRGSRIVVMSGFKNEYGLSDNIDLTESELVYFIHILGRGKGNYRRLREYKLKNHLFGEAKFYNFEGPGTVLPRGKNLSVVLSRGRIICIDFYAKFVNYEADLPDFINFLEGFRIP